MTTDEDKKKGKKVKLTDYVKQTKGAMISRGMKLRKKNGKRKTD